MPFLHYWSDKSHNHSCRRSRVDFRSPVPEDPRIDAPLAESRFLQFARFLWPISFSCSDSLDKSFRAEPEWPLHPPSGPVVPPTRAIWVSSAVSCVVLHAPAESVAPIVHALEHRHLSQHIRLLFLNRRELRILPNSNSTRPISRLQLLISIFVLLGKRNERFFC